MRYRKNVGDNGEDFAANMLRDAGYSILCRNFYTRFGEIDIVACKDGVIHFVEVKTRTSDRFGYPSDAITEEKKARMRRCAEIYLTGRRNRWRSISIDVYEVMSNFIVGCV